MTGEERQLQSMTLLVGWADLDANGHMANTAYLNMAVDTRLKFFADAGFPVTKFMQMGIGPIALKDEIEYFREFRLHDEVVVTLKLAGMSEDCSRGIWINEFHRGDVVSARVTSQVAWLDQTARKLVVPPAELVEAVRGLPRAADFSTIPSLIR